MFVENNMTNTRQILGTQSRRVKTYTEADLLEELKREEERQPKKPSTPGEGVSNPEAQVQPIDFGVARFLGDEWGRKVHEKIIAKYGKFTVIGKLSNVYGLNEKVVKASSHFYAVAANEFLLPFGIRTATQAELEKIFKAKTLELKGHYIDTGLVWRTNDDPNGYLAKYLFEQFKKKSITLNEGTPYVVPLHCLRLNEDGKSEYGLSFDLTGLTGYFQAPILNVVTQQFFEDSDIDEKTGLPKEVRADGSRKLYTRNWNDYAVKNSGLSELSLNSFSNLESCVDGLALSIDNGRVVCVTSEATAFEKLGRDLK
jgi:hypothetical protein